jgi:hypothetical protein
MQATKSTREPAARRGLSGGLHDVSAPEWHSFLASRLPRRPRSAAPPPSSPPPSSDATRVVEFRPPQTAPIEGNLGAGWAAAYTARQRPSATASSPPGLLGVLARSLLHPPVLPRRWLPLEQWSSGRHRPCPSKGTQPLRRSLLTSVRWTHCRFSLLFVCFVQSSILNVGMTVQVNILLNVLLVAPSCLWARGRNGNIIFHWHFCSILIFYLFNLNNG